MCDYDNILSHALGYEISDRLHTLLFNYLQSKSILKIIIFHTFVTNIYLLFLWILAICSQIPQIKWSLLCMYFTCILFDLRERNLHINCYQSFLSSFTGSHLFCLCFPLIIKLVRFIASSKYHNIWLNSTGENFHSFTDFC